MVELFLKTDVDFFTESKKRSLITKLETFFEDKEIVVRNLIAQPYLYRVIIVFYVKNKETNSSLNGTEIVKKLNKDIRRVSNVLQLTVSKIQTLICQNNCSGKN